MTGRRISAVPAALLAAALLAAGAAGALAAPAAAAPAVAPPSVLRLTLSSSQVVAGASVDVAASVTIPDGTPAAGRVELRLVGATGSVPLHGAPVSGPAPVRTTLTPAPGRYTVVARFTPTRAIDQTAAEASAPLRANGTADLQLTWPPLTAGRTATVQAVVRTTTAAHDLAGTVRLEWDGVASFAACPLQPLSTTVGECELRLPAAITAGTHPVNAVWTGDDRFVDANATGTATVAPAPSSDGSSGTGAGAGAGAGTGDGTGGATGSGPGADAGSAAEGAGEGTAAPLLGAAGTAAPGSDGPSVSIAPAPSAPVVAGAETGPPAASSPLLLVVAAGALLAVAAAVLLVRRRAPRSRP